MRGRSVISEYGNSVYFSHFLKSETIFLHCSTIRYSCFFNGYFRLHSLLENSVFVSLHVLYLIFANRSSCFIHTIVFCQ